MPSSHLAARQKGQIMTEYCIVAGILVIALFMKMPGQDKSAVQMLIVALKQAWASYSFVLSYPL